MRLAMLSTRQHALTLAFSADRRAVLATGFRWLAGCGAVGLLADHPGLLNAQVPRQHDWRFCHRCQAMFFDGYPTKGACAAGGAHEAAGYNFDLTHEVGETGGAQKNWRYCAKCQTMFYDGFPDKGRCVKGGGHQSAGFNFVLPHDSAETPTAQKNWRFCGKCHVMFFDGFPTKGVCGAGGTHQAAGFNFVLAHQTDYPGKVDHLAQQGRGLENVIKIMWNEAGRAIVADKVQQAVNGRRFANGVNGYNAHASIGDIFVNWRPIGPNRFSVELKVPGNDCEFHATTPTVFGSYGDPAFRVGFGLVVNLNMGVRNARPPIDIAVVEARTTEARVHGSNAVGTLVETVADFFTRGDFSRRITDQINGDPSLKASMAQAIGSALDRVW